MSRKNPYSSDLAMLRDYLKRGFDPYDFADHLTGFYAFERDDVPDWVDSDEPWNSDFSRMSAADAKDFERYVINQDVNELSPSTAFFTFKKIVPRTTWLVHFSDNVDKILKDGLICGHEEAQSLGLTTQFKNAKHCRPGWNFAFEYNSRYAEIAARGRHGHGKYGDDFVMFQSAGVKAWHNGDEEDQVILWGSLVKDIVPVFQDNSGDYSVTSNVDSGKAYVVGDYKKVAQWVVDNFRAYRNMISYVKE